MSTTPQKTLLVVDDDPRIRRAIARTLAGEPWRTLHTDSGPRAIEILSREEVHVVLSDYHMPEMDGITLLDEIRRRWPHVVRIMLTSDDDAHVFVNAVNDAEVRRFLHKPWHDEQLRGALRAVMRTAVISRVPRDEPAPERAPRRTPSVEHFFLERGLYEPLVPRARRPT